MLTCSAYYNYYMVSSICREAEWKCIFHMKSLWVLVIWINAIAWKMGIWLKKKKDTDLCGLATDWSNVWHIPVQFSMAGIWIFCINDFPLQTHCAPCPARSHWWWHTPVRIPLVTQLPRLADFLLSGATLSSVAKADICMWRGRGSNWHPCD